MPKALNQNLLSVMLSVGLALSWGALEAVQLLEHPSGDFLLSTYAVSFAGMLLPAALVTVAPRLLASVVSCVVVSIATACVGGVFVWASLFGPATLYPLFPVGIGILAASAALLSIMWIRLLALSSVSSRRMSVFVAALLGTALVLLLGYAPSIVCLVVACACFVASALMALAWRRQRPGEEPEKRIQKRRPVKLTAPILIGLVVTNACFGFWQTNLISGYADFALANIVITHVIAAVIFVLVATFLVDDSYCTTYRLVNSLMLAAFVALVVAGDFAGILPSFFMAIGFSVFEYAYMLALAELIESSSTPANRIAGAFMLLSGVALFIGCAFGWGDAYLGVPLSGLSPFGLVLVLALIVSSVWLITDRHLNAFFWRHDEQDGEEETAEPQESAAVQLTFDEKFLALADEHSLSEREREITLLFAKGRSSSFIADQLYVSSSTVRTHLMHAYAKLDVHSRQELISLIEGVEAE